MHGLPHSESDIHTDGKQEMVNVLKKVDNNDAKREVRMFLCTLEQNAASDFGARPLNLAHATNWAKVTKV